MESRRAAVVGAGTMGAGIAQVMASSGFEVVLVDIDAGALERARQRIAASLGKLQAKGALAGGTPEEVLGRITFTSDTARMAGSEVAIEAVVEDRATKSRVLEVMGGVCGEGALLASNTSSISITELARSVPDPRRFMGVHFMNPVPIMKLVELVRGQDTAEETVTEARELCRRLGKTPVEAADYPGFLSNRILMPMINEAIYCLMEGVGDVQAIDTVMTLGMNHPMGPLRLADLIGLDVCLDIMEVLHRGLGDKYRPCPLLRRMVAAGRLGRKSGRGFYVYE